MTHQKFAPFVQWLGHQIFTLETGVQFPYGVPLQFNKMVGFPSGQRDQTVNLTAPPSKVRILPQPPSRINTTHFCVVFLFYFYKKGCIIIICMNININSLDILCDEIGGENV